jgi:hypothetical protein
MQLNDLLVQEREQILMRDPTAVEELIPQLAWAVNAVVRDFYGNINT